MLSSQVDLLDGLIEISDQSSSQLHMNDESPNLVMISCGHHDSFSSFLGTACEVAVLYLLYMFLHFMS
jgi:hypothetical protein